MQCQQPLFGNSIPGPAQYFPSNPVNPQNGLAPDVIGEGEVNSITFPDGSIQYYFLPVRWQSDIYWKQWPPYPFNDNLYCNYSKPNTGVWIIRNFSNTISPVYNQYWQRTNLDPFTKQYYDQDCNAIPAGFQLKFHNDSWTSTTDLHCFCPRISLVPPVAAACTAAAQVAIPNHIKCSCHTSGCNDHGKSTDCMLNIMKECNNLIKRYKGKKLEKNNSSRMSIDKLKTSSSSWKSSTDSSQTCLTNPKSKKNKHKKSSKKKHPKKSIVFCDKHSTANETEDANKNSQICERHRRQIETDSKCNGNDAVQDNGVAGGHKFGEKCTTVNFQCGFQNTVDKVVATYTDQASSVPEAEGQTQTECRCQSATDVKTHQRSMRRLCHQRRKAASSEKLIGVYELSSNESLCTTCKYGTSRDSVN